MRKEELDMLPLPFYINSGVFYRWIPSQVMFTSSVIHFMSTTEGWMKDVFRDLLKEAKVEDSLIDLILTGDYLDHKDETPLASIGGMDFTHVYNTDAYDWFKMGDGVNVAISGKHTKSGKPMLLNSINGHTYAPSAYFLCGIHWTEKGK
jgi:hypothetical protein